MLLKAIKFHKKLRKNKDKENEVFIEQNLVYLSRLFTAPMRIKASFKNFIYDLLMSFFIGILFFVISLPFYALIVLIKKEKEMSDIIYAWMLLGSMLLSILIEFAYKIHRLVYAKCLYKIKLAVKEYLKDKPQTKVNSLIEEIITDKEEIRQVDFSKYAQTFNVKNIDAFLEKMENLLLISTKTIRKSLSKRIVEKLIVISVFCLALFLLMEAIIDFGIQFEYFKGLHTSQIISISLLIFAIFFVAAHNVKSKLIKKTFLIILSHLTDKSSELYINVKMEQTLEIVRNYRFLLKENKFKQKYVFLIFDQINIFNDKHIVYGINKKFDFIKIETIRNNLDQIQAFVEQSCL
ncbi:hypothetical protein [[Mycoplasma] gypis]|uniref:ABC transmembrane type-1 domain-containing protein n=1 Tax=[Mycoplasma] gypis TaxID=92404 RepID=A0ABZ2RP42_9BACT|nr:hypothetical protein [[Mycoplasma] gypis]MBN0919059.1 hypothetical protein [[Mycoplasma] gypis]